MKNKVLVSGASGFVGQALLTQLISQKEHGEIIALHRHPLAKNIDQKFRDPVRWVKGDLTKDDFTSALVDVKTVFHLAAYSSISESPEECREMNAVNVEGTKRFALASKESGVRHFIFVSSIAACEIGAALDINEENGLPVSAYGKSKRAAEDFLLSISNSEFNVTILRPTALFGENHLGSVYELVKAVNKNRFIIFGDGCNRTNFYYINDFIDVLMKVKNDLKSHGQLYIAADKPYSLRELVSFIVKSLETKKSPRKLPKFLGFFLATILDFASALIGKPLPLSKRRFRAMTRDVAYLNKKLETSLSVHANYGLSVGIANAVEWYRKEGLI